MNQDRSSSAPLIICAAVLLFAAAFFARAILAPVTFAIFIVAIIWPLQDAFEKRLPKLVALVLTLAVTLAVLSIMGFLVVWAFGLVAQWLIANVARFQAIYLRAIELLESHGVAVHALMATSLNPSSVTGVLRQNSITAVTAR